MRNGVQKMSSFKINIEKNTDGTYELDFLRDNKSMFCMDAKISRDAARRYIEKLERYVLDCSSVTYKMDLLHTHGDRINFEYENDFGWSDGLDTNLVISYPTNKNGAISYKDRKICMEKLDFIKEFYKVFITISVDAQSQLIESIIDMGDLESYYERIA